MSAATRARTIAATTTSLQVGVLDRTESLLRHALAVDGSLLFLAPAGSPLAAASMLPESPVVTATALDVAPVPTADRLRGSVVFHGRPRPVRRRLPAPLVSFLCGEETSPGRPVLELTPEAVQLHWHVEEQHLEGRGGGSQAVAPSDYAAAQPDPLAGWEAGFLRHLDDDHSSLLPQLAAGAGVAVPEGWRIRPVLVDADGLVLRAAPVGNDVLRRDVRLSFERRATCGCEAVEGFNELLERAERAARVE